MNGNWILSGVAALAIVVVPTHLRPHLQGTGHFPFGGHMDPAHAQMLEQLRLSPDQMSAIHQTLGDYHMKMLKAFAQSGLTPDQRNQAAKGLRLEVEGKLAKILNADQLAKLKAAHGDESLFGTVFDRIHEVMAQLDLTDTQRQAVARIAGEGHAQIQKLMADRALSPQQRHAKVQALHETILRSIHENLTPAQLEKVHEVMKNLHGGSSN